MPIFNDDALSHTRGSPPPPTKTEYPFRSSPASQQLRRQISEESIRTELCEGPVPDDLSALLSTRTAPNDSIRFERSDSQGVSNRVELIERLKRNESRAWLPNRHLKTMYQEYDRSVPSGSSITDSSSPPSLLPAANIKESPKSPSALNGESLQQGLAIERPRSALHSGDFTQNRPESGIEKRLNPQTDQESSQPHYSLVEPWLSTSPPRHFTPFQRNSMFTLSSHLEQDFRSRPRSRAPSLSSSLSSSFVFKAPTSPLVQSESNDDVDFSSSMKSIDIEGNSSPNARRHTYQSSYSSHSTPLFGVSSSFDRSLPSLRRDPSYPYQAHQPRRSLTSNQGTSQAQTQSSPQTPALLRSRRPSFSSDCSSLQHASMVGSYEESILRGRMSTTPSRPLDFVAQIGVLGLGKSVFYSYGNTSHGRSGKSEDGPSPYVGLIDIENGLPNQHESTLESKRKRSHVTSEQDGSTDVEMFDFQTTPQISERDRRRAQKQKRRSTSPRSPPGGSYRIPEKGQLQIIIKNPNKTAVKLFLVPYDLEGMEPGTKTFIRQISYSVSPVFDPIISSPQPQSDLNERKTLRYLLHLHICSPSRSRYYLYRSIRVVFANRVPDGKEKLKNVIKWPEPKWSVYKPGRESGHGLGNHGPGASLAAEKAFRRRSSGFTLSPSNRNDDAMDGSAQSLHESKSSGLPFCPENGFITTPVEPIPFGLFSRKSQKQGEENNFEDSSHMFSPTSSKSSRPPTSQDSGTSASWNSIRTAIGGYDKLNKCDLGYGGNAFTGIHNGQQINPEGLLALKLRSLGVVGMPEQEQDTLSALSD